MKDTSKTEGSNKVEILSAALVGAALGAITVALANTDNQEKIAEGFEDIKSKVFDRVKLIQSELKSKGGKGKEILTNELKKARAELDKAEKLLNEQN